MTLIMKEIIECSVGNKCIMLPAKSVVICILASEQVQVIA